MKPKKKKLDGQSQANVYDPEPITIVLSILSAISPIGVLIADKKMDGLRENKRREENIRKSLFAAARALNATERVLKDFVSFMDQAKTS